MKYANHLLQDKVYCHTIVGVNWTRWSHTDETLFDLIDEFVPRDERNPLRKALLRADLRFEQPLGQLKAPWADVWRMAIRERTWDGAKDFLLQMDVRGRLSECALAVVAEELMGYHDLCLQRLEMTDPEMTDPLYIHSFQQKDQILRHCRWQGIEIDITKYLSVLSSGDSH
jgi:hypothetical protein